MARNQILRKENAQGVLFLVILSPYDLKKMVKQFSMRKRKKAEVEKGVCNVVLPVTCSQLPVQEQKKS